MSQTKTNRFAPAVNKAQEENTSPRTQLSMNIDPVLLKRLRFCAAMQDRPMKEIVAEALTEYLNRSQVPNLM